MTTKNVALLPAPVLIIATGLAFMSQMFPLSLNSGSYYGQDPAYQYLFAGVDILQGHSPVHTDHPGTPLQSLIALTIVVVWLARMALSQTGTDIFESVLIAPEIYMASVSLLLLVLAAVASYVIGWRVYRATQSLLAGISCQFTAVLFVFLSPYIVYPTPEAILLSISVCLMAVLAPALLGSKEEPTTVTTKTAICAGILCGIGVAVKITFAPLLGLLISLRRGRLISTAILVMVLAWFLGILPVLSRLPVMFAWFHQVLTHSALHGQGEQVIFNWVQFKQNAVLLVKMFPLLYEVLFTLALFLALGCLKYVVNMIWPRSTSGGRGQVAVSAGLRMGDLVTPFALVLVGLAQTVMVAKHPGPTYMIAILPITVIGGVWLIFIQRIVVLSRPIRQIMAVAWIVLLLQASYSSIVTGYRAVQAIHKVGAQSASDVKREINHFQNPLVIGTFNCNLPLCALWFGILLVPEMELKMDPITPEFYHFDIFARKLHLPGIGELSVEDTASTINRLVQSGRPVLLVSPPYEHLAQFRLETLLDTPIQNLYRVTGFQQHNK